MCGYVSNIVGWQLAAGDGVHMPVASADFVVCCFSSSELSFLFVCVSAPTSDLATQSTVYFSIQQLLTGRHHISVTHSFTRTFAHLHGQFTCCLLI